MRVPTRADPDRGCLAGEESYLATDKGAINWGHVLVLPVEHYRSGLACPPSTAAEMGRYLAALRLCYKAQACTPAGFDTCLTTRRCKSDCVK